jgi:CheY-like chemotaxis protein
MTKQSSSILLVDTDPANAQLVAAFLKAQGHTVLAAKDGAHALSIMQFRAFDVLIIDMQHSVVGEIDVIKWATSVCPKPRIVAMGANSSSGQEKGSLMRGAGIFLKKPLDKDRLTEFLEPTKSRSSFTGTVDEVDIIEYLQFVLLGGRKTILEVTSSVGTRGRLYINDGRVEHAICGILDGEPAFYRCMCFKCGNFSHATWKDPGEKTIDKPYEFLLMEAVRKRDEVWGETNPGEEFL